MKPLSFAYADPPYTGQAKKHYRDDPQCAEVDHRRLILDLTLDYDAWALSLSTPSLPEILPRCPKGCRVGAWVKPFCAFKANVNPAYAWEPVIFYSGRKRTRQQPTVRDYCREPITLRRGLHGVKPEGFCFWVFAFLGALPGDDFTDVFPGSGAVGRAWLAYQAVYENLTFVG